MNNLANIRIVVKKYKLKDFHPAMADIPPLVWLCVIIEYACSAFLFKYSMSQIVDLYY